MPGIATQKQFRDWKKPSFCYLCGEILADGSKLNRDHCPPQGIFAAEDRINYPLLLRVHERCNHRWHGLDEKMAIFYDVLHGATKASDPKLAKKLKFVDVRNEQGVYRGITEFPLRPLTHRIIRFAHALLYDEFLPSNTPNRVHYPIPEVDPATSEPVMHEMHTYAFADAICRAQKTGTHDFLSAYNSKFRYVCTWSSFDNGQPVCLFSLDIYRLADFAVKIEQFPRAIIGAYQASVPLRASKCSSLFFDNTDDEILYPIL